MRKTLNAPLLNKTSSVIQIVHDKRATSANTRLTTYKNLRPIMDFISPFINAFTINNIVASFLFIISPNKPMLIFHISNI